MGEICSKIVDGDHNPPPGQPNPTKFVMVSSKNIANDKICNISDVRYLTEHDFYSAHKRTYVEKGDILFTSVASLGRTCIYSLEEPVTFQRSVTVINTLIYNKYLKLFLDSPIYQNYVNDNARGTAQKGFYINQISDSLVPIPPLSEQIRLATKVEELLNTVCQLELLKDDLGNNIKKIKSTILDMAIIGRLIPQNPSDEPAIQLIRTINPDFRSTDNRHYENKPFSIPDSWVWVMGKDLFLPMKNCKPSGEYFKYIDIDSIDNQDCVIKCTKVLPVTAAPSRATRYTQVGDILFSMVRPYLKNIAIVTEGNCIASTGFYVCSPNKALFSKYCYYLMISPYVINGLTQFMKGDNSPSINNAHISEWLYPLPPLNEQKKIVQKIDEIFNYLDSIVAEL